MPRVSARSSSKLPMSKRPTQDSAGTSARRSRRPVKKTKTVKATGKGSRDASGERAKKLDRLLANVESKLDNGDFKASIGDFVRLLQLRKELEEERPREITVRWVEPSGEEHVSVT